MCRCSRNTCIVLVGIVAIGTGVWMKFVKTGIVYESQADLAGKTVLITGGNTGIGKETAIGLAKLKARVIITSRNAEKGAKAVEEIIKITGNSGVKFLLLDLAELQNIRLFAREFMETEKRLDILVNNAGVMLPGKTKDGFNLIFGVNQLGPFLLTNLLLPLMRKTSKKSPVRIVNVSSSAYLFGKVDFENFDLNIDETSTTLDGLEQYSNTKLMNIYFTSELDRRLKDEFSGKTQAITTYALHPGSVKTNLGKGFAQERAFLSSIVRTLWEWFVTKPVFYGAQTILYCCLEDGIESGKYFNYLQQEELWEHARDPEVGSKLWELCKKLTGLSS